MSAFLIHEETLTDIANAIREKTQSQAPIIVSNFSSEIENIPTGPTGDNIWNWGDIGYDYIPQKAQNDLEEATNFSYSKQIYDNWDDTQTNLLEKFRGDKNLIYMPLVDTSNAINTRFMFYNCTNLINVPLLDLSNVENTSWMFGLCNSLETIPLFDTSSAIDMSYMFSYTKITTLPLLNTSNAEYLTSLVDGCTTLTTIPVLNTSHVKSMKNMFYNVTNLTNESLDNILQMCINAVNYEDTKTLADLALGSYSKTKIKALPHYQDFINAGWNLGF